MRKLSIIIATVLIRVTATRRLPSSVINGDPKYIITDETGTVYYDEYPPSNTTEESSEVPFDPMVFLYYSLVLAGVFLLSTGWMEMKERYLEKKRGEGKREPPTRNSVLEHIVFVVHPNGYVMGISKWEFYRNQSEAAILYNLDRVISANRRRMMLARSCHCMDDYIISIGHRYVPPPPAIDFGKNNESDLENSSLFNGKFLANAIGLGSWW